MKIQMIVREWLLRAFHVHLVAWYLETSLLAGAGLEMFDRALCKRIVWRSERFSFGVLALLIFP